MSINLILKQASELCMKQYSDYTANVTGTCIAALVGSGVEFEKAASLAKEALGDDPVCSILLSNADTLEKAASMVEGIETEIQKQASDADSAVEQAKFVKLAEAGFSETEAKTMLSLSSDVIEKIASLRNSDGENFDLGRAEGMSANSVDPLMAFCMSGPND